MGNVRYTPRFKFGILKHKRIIFSGKNISKLKKNKWSRFFKSNFSKSFALRFYIRNDITICLESQRKKQRILDLRRQYSRAFFSVKQFSCYYRTVKTPFFQNLFLEKVNKYQRLPINTIFNFVEFRLDVLLLKTNFVKSLYHSRWLISSGFVFINNAVCRAISYRVSIGDNVRIKKFFFLRKYFFSISSFNLPSEFLEINYDLLSFVIITVPGFFTKQLIAKQYSFFLYAAFNVFICF